SCTGTPHPPATSASPASDRVAFSFTTYALVSGVAVTPDSATSPPRLANTTGGPFGYQASFTIQNTGDASTTYTLTCAGSSNVTCNYVNPTSVTLAPGASAPAHASYRVGAVGTGSLRVTAP